MAGNLTHDEARERARLLQVDGYDVELILDADAETFATTTVARFGCAEPGAETFAELVAARVDEVTLNGAPAPYDPHTGRIRLAGLAPDNELRAVAGGRYSRSGQGLHRFVDPVDDRVYLWTQLAPADAQCLFACFDQPDLKAPLRFTVSAPADWQVVSNAAEIAREGDRRRFAQTPPLPTYLGAIVAGPYHVVADEHVFADGRRIPMRLLCRASLAGDLDADELFAITHSGLDWFPATFATPYPFDKYDHAFVPEMTSFAAMENAACVTLRDDLLFRSRVTDGDHERRANIMLHEMAHMWFGDLVTMRWWDDTWLNESFATWAGTLATVDATRWDVGWITFADRYKAVAYRQDQLPSTHPVIADIPDLQSMEVNFDGITYQKGASVLKQLTAAIGVETFLTGLRTYFARHAWGNTEFGDLLAALSEAGGEDLGAWSRQWLTTTGPNTLRALYTVDDAGRFTSFAVEQTAAPAHPTLRRHRIAIGLYARGDGGLVRRGRVETTIDGPRTTVPELVGAARPDLVLLNDDDLTYAKVRLDPGSLATVRSGIAEITDPLAQAVCWTLAWDMTRDAELPARDYLALVLAGVRSVRSGTTRETLLDQARTAARLYSDPAWRADGLPAAADALLELARAAAAGSDEQLSFARAFAALATTPVQLDVVAGWYGGTADLPGLAVDADLRWALLRRLVAAGRSGPRAVDAEEDRDATASGRRFAATCRAALPTVEGKREAWQRIVGGELSTAELRATLDGFTEPGQLEPRAPYAQEYFAVLREAVDRWPIERTVLFAKGAYPGDGGPEVVGTTDAFLAEARPPAWLRRLLVEGRDELQRTLRARDHDAR
jgi:aminopeptidase N